MEENDGCTRLTLLNLKSALQQNVKLFILCNPHNPGGIVWTKEELQRND